MRYASRAEQRVSRHKLRPAFQDCRGRPGKTGGNELAPDRAAMAPLSVPPGLLYATGVVREPYLTQRVWLALAGGRIAAFRLDARTELNAAVLARLVEASTADSRGERVEIDVASRSAFPLYAAPAEPPAGNQEALDKAIVDLLHSLNGIRVFDTVRNYNRLITLDAEQRRNRMQAIAQYPAILSHIFLTPHMAYDLVGGHHHRWRQHDEELIAAVDGGQSLLPLLAARGGVTRSVFRGSAFAENWPSLGLARPLVLHVLDGMPAHRRPATPDELALAAPVFGWLSRQGIHAPGLLKRIGSEFFREGIATAIARLERRHGENGIDDTGDFVRAAAVFLDQQQKTPPPADVGSGDPWLAAWLTRHGLWPLLTASARWHTGMAERAHLRAVDRERLPLVLGHCRVGNWEASELDSVGALQQEGECMRHCVATRWPDCAAGGARIFALSQTTATKGERATAQFDLAPDAHGGLRYLLRELRGPANAAVGAGCRKAAQRIATLLNTRERGPARAAAAEAAVRYRAPAPPSAWLDEESRRMALLLAEPPGTIS